MSHGSVYSSDTRVVFKHTSNAGTLRNVSSHTWWIGCQMANWRIWHQQVFIHAVTEAFITPSTLRSRLYYVMLPWPAW